MRRSTLQIGSALFVAIVALLGFCFPSDAAMVAHWNFDNNLLDDSGNGNHLTVATGTESYGAAGPNGGAASFDFDGATMINNNAPTNFGFSSAYTFAAWVQAPLPGPSNYYGAFHVGSPGSSDLEVYVQASSNDMVLVHNRSNPGGGAFGALQVGDPPNNTYYHLAHVYDGVNARTYYNGVLQGTNAMGNLGISPGRQVSLGKLNHSLFTPNFMTGLMDEAHVFNTALTLQQLNNLRLFNDINGPQPVIPEPATLALVGLGGLALVDRNRRSRQRATA